MCIHTSHINFFPPIWSVNIWNYRLIVLSYNHTIQKHIFPQKTLLRQEICLTYSPWLKNLKSYLLLHFKSRKKKYSSLYLQWQMVTVLTSIYFKMLQWNIFYFLIVCELFVIWKMVHDIWEIASFLCHYSIASFLCHTTSCAWLNDTGCMSQCALKGWNFRMISVLTVEWFTL